MSSPRQASSGQCFVGPRGGTYTITGQRPEELRRLLKPGNLSWVARRLPIKAANVVFPVRSLPIKISAYVVFIDSRAVYREISALQQ
jgi:hypothetical protein